MLNTITALSFYHIDVKHSNKLYVVETKKLVRLNSNLYLKRSKYNWLNSLSCSGFVGLEKWLGRDNEWGGKSEVSAIAGWYSTGKGVNPSRSQLPPRYISTRHIIGFIYFINKHWSDIPPPIHNCHFTSLCVLIFFLDRWGFLSENLALTQV